MQATRTATDRLLSVDYRRRFIAIMFLVCLFNFADRAVFAVLAQPIKEDLRLTDFQIGILQGLAFALLYSTVGLPIGRLAERSSRVRIVAAATAFWSLATVACGLAGNFGQLMLARIGVGMGEAGFLPPTNSLVGDHFPRERRASTMALIMMGTPIGLFLGAVAGGAVAAAAGWRAAFLVLGIPGLVVALLAVALLREPSRGLVDGVPPTKAKPPGFGAFLGELRRKRSLMLVIGGGSLAGFGMTAVSQFLAVFLARAHDMGVGEAAGYYGIISGVALGFGLLVGSFGTDWLSRRDVRWPAWGAAIGLFASPPIFWLAFSVENKAAAVVLLIVAIGILLLYYGPTSGMIQNLLEPRMRATGSALFAMLYTLIGAGLGPTFIGFMSDRLAELAYPGGGFLVHCPGGLPPDAADVAHVQLCAAASAAGIRHGLMLSVFVFFVAGLCYLVAARTLPVSGNKGYRMKFPDTRNFAGFFAPSGVEAEVSHLPVIEGEVPIELDGAFFRVAPDPQFPPLAGDDIWFNGDGMVTRFRFKDGEIGLKQRWVRTEKFRLEREAGRPLFGAYRNPLTDDPSVKGKVRGTANTNVVVHAGKLLALKEDSRAVAMDPETLETIGEWDFGGRITSDTFTAHPKVDPKTGEMLAFAYAAKGLLTRDMAFYVISAGGEVTREVWFELPYYCMMHDFAITEDYAVFHVVPITSDWGRLEAGKPHFGFNRTRPIYLGVLPRDGTAEDLRWFTAPTCFASHVMNAFNEGPLVHFDTPMAAGNMFPFFPDYGDAPFNPAEAQSRLTRWTVDMKANSDEIAMRQLTDLVGEFPRIDDRFAGSKYRHGYLLVQDLEKPVDLPGGRSASGMMMNTLAHIDIETGEKDVYWIGPVSSLQEPAFIPRPGSSEEGDGYLVTIENRLAEMGSRLLLFDARKLSAGPIATIGLPFRMRPGLHGNWYTADKLAA